MKRVVLVILLALVISIVGNRHACSLYWQTFTVDSVGDVGKYTAIVLDSSGLPHISYWDESNKGLRYAYFDGLAWQFGTVDSTDDVGEYTLIALDTLNLLHISYYDATNTDLKYAYFDGGAWQIERVDSTDDVGEYTSIVIDGLNRPHISYYDNTNGALKYAVKTGDVWQDTLLDMSGDVGQYTSITVDSLNYPHISYYDVGNSALKYAYYDDSWHIETVESFWTVGRYTSLGLDENGYPHISYYYGTGEDLKYARYDGDSWEGEKVDSLGDVGRYTSVEIDALNHSYISYYDVANKRLKYAHFNGTEWELEFVDSVGEVGQYTSLDLNEDGISHISYYDVLNADLKYAIGVVQPKVVATDPANNTINIILSTNISVTFDSDMDSASINDTTFIAMGNLSGLHLGSTNYNSGTKTATLDPFSDFLPGEVITVVLTEGIKDTSGIPIEGYVWNFTIAALNGKGELSVPLNFSAHDGPYGIYTTDLNNDNNLDLVVTNITSEDISILFGNGDGTFSAPINYNTGPEPYTVACGDLDRDGDNDYVVACSGEDRIRIYLNDGVGGLTYLGTYNTDTDPRSIYLSDFDRDGNLDAAIANYNGNSVSVLLGIGDGTFQTNIDYDAGLSPSGVYGGDFDGDGDIDLAVSLRVDNEILILINDGDGSFLQGDLFPTGSRPYDIYSASLNSGDDHLDLAVPNWNDDNISKLLGNGNGTFAGSVEYPVSDKPICLYCTDMDFDGDLDIVVSNSGLDSITLLYNDGNAGFDSLNNFYGGDGVALICAGDFNNDRSIDIAVACSNADSVAVFLNYGDTTGPLVTTPGTSPGTPPQGTPELTVWTTLSDSESNIANAVCYVDSTTGTPFSMHPEDGVWDSLCETVFDTLDISTWIAGDTHWIYVRGEDVFHNWSRFDSVSVPVTEEVDTFPPTILYTTPANSDTGVPLNTWMRAHASEPLNPATIDKIDDIYVWGSKNGDYAIDYLDYQGEDSTIRFYTPLIEIGMRFAPSESIVVTIDSTIEDLAGNEMENDYTWWFKTGLTADTTAPSVVAIDVTPDTTWGASYVTLTARVSDNRIVDEVEYFIDSIGASNTGYPMSPVDGNYDEATEDAIEESLFVDTLSEGAYRLYVHGRDGLGNWGGFDSVAVVVYSPVLSFTITVIPDTVLVGQNAIIEAVANLPILDVPGCTVSTSDGEKFGVGMSLDTLRIYTGTFSTVGKSIGDATVTVSGIDSVLGNTGSDSTTFRIIAGGEFLPEDKVFVYPNPAPMKNEYGNKVFFRYYVNQNADVVVEVFNLKGKRVFSRKVSGEGGRVNEISWDIRKIASDAYIFRLEAEAIQSGEKRSVMKKLAIVK